MNKQIPETEDPIMKRNNLTLMLILTFGLFLFYSCGGGGKVGEPNDKIEQANAVTLEKPFKMKIDEKGDRDWYSVDIPAQGYLKIMAKNVAEEIEPEGAISVFEEWQSNENEFMKSWTKIPFAAAIPEKGTYHIAIIDNYNDAMSKQKFEVKFSFIEEFDDFEQNNNPKQANKVEFDKEYKSAIYPVGDNDWFKIKTKEPGYVTVKAKNVPEALELETRYVNYDEYEADKIDVFRNYGQLPHSAAIPEPGEFYFHILDNYNDAEADKLFDWKIEFLPEMDQAEPNNEMKHAKVLNANDTLSLAIFPKGDVDIYKLNVDKKGTLKLKAKGYETIEPEVHLAVKDTTGKNELKEIGGWQKLPAELEIQDTNKEYYVKIIDNYNDAEYPKAFTVVSEFK
jgi:hypothetical protein